VRRRGTVVGAVTAAVLLGVLLARPSVEKHAFAPTGRLPISFEPNVGQAPADVPFVARIRGATALLSSQRAIVLRPSSAPVTLKLAAAARVDGEGEERLPGTVSHMAGNDPSAWRTGAPTWGRVVFRGVYPGIDLVFHGERGDLEYDFVIAPGADPERIHLELDGAPPGPVALYEVDPAGKQGFVDGGCARRGEALVFEVGARDPLRRLVIDPVLVYGTTAGAPGGNALDIAVDDAGAAYFAGWAFNGGLLTVNALQTMPAASLTPFVAKLNPGGASLAYSTYLGGSNDSARAIAVDAQGNAYVAGTSMSGLVPTTQGAYQRTPAGTDAFVVKLSPSGSLVYGTLLGGEAQDDGYDVAVDGAGRAYVVGDTVSTMFPVTAGAPQMALAAGLDGFLTVLDPSGASLVASTYLGGSGVDSISRVALDPTGAVYAAGLVSVGFPLLTRVQGYDGGVFTGAGGIARFAPMAASLQWATMFPGISTIDALVIDDSGRAYAGGSTMLTADLLTVNALQQTCGCGKDTGRSWGDGFVLELDPTGSTLLFSTYFGGGPAGTQPGTTLYGTDDVTGIAFAPDGGMYLSGYSYSNAFACPADCGVFVARLKPGGAGVDYCQCFGGRSDGSGGIALDPAGNIYLSGTSTGDVPLLNGVAGAPDAGVFVIELGDFDASSAGGGSGGGGSSTGGSSAGGSSAGGNGTGGSSTVGPRLYSVGCGCGSAVFGPSGLLIAALVRRRLRLPAAARR
jgi:hypothetical protein